MHTQAQAVLTGPGSEITSLRTLFGELLADRNTVRHLANLLSGADLRYEMGQASAGDAGVSDTGAGDTGAGELIGRWAPDLALQTETGSVRLAELTRTARPLLLDLTDGGRLVDVAKPWLDRVDVITARSENPDLTALLLRPDGYVAWASNSAHPDDQQREALQAALTHWFGR
jgi:hypothetical protein